MKAEIVRLLRSSTLTAREIAHELRVPTREAEAVLRELMDEHLVQRLSAPRAELYLLTMRGAECPPPSP